MGYGDIIMSFIAGHKAAWSAHKAQKTQATLAPSVVSTADQIWEDQILTDKQWLKSSYPDHSERNKHKAKVLDKYRDYLTRLINDRANRPSKVLVNCCIWAADVGDFELAITLAHIGNHQHSGMERDLRTFVADTLLQSTSTDYHNAMRQHLFKKLLSGEWSLNKPLTRKYYVWAAKFYRTTQPHEALEYAKTAQVLDNNAGMKQFIVELEQELKQKSPPVQVVGQASMSDSKTVLADMERLPEPPVL